MNKIRNHIGLIVSLVVFLALLGVSLFFFWQLFRMRNRRGGWRYRKRAIRP